MTQGDEDPEWIKRARGWRSEEEREARRQRIMRTSWGILSDPKTGWSVFDKEPHPDWAKAFDRAAEKRLSPLHREPRFGVMDVVLALVALFVLVWAVHWLWRLT